MESNTLTAAKPTRAQMRHAAKHLPGGLRNKRPKHRGRRVPEAHADAMEAAAALRQLCARRSLPALSDAARGTEPNPGSMNLSPYMRAKEEAMRKHERDLARQHGRGRFL